MRHHPGTMALQQKKDAAGQGASYEYDPAGWLKKRTWARGVSATYAHNVLGELTGIDYSDATPDVTLTRDAEGRVTAVGDGTGGWSYGYDASGRLEREVHAASGDALIFQRDEAGRRKREGVSFRNSLSSPPRHSP
jgi:YD repeat-containing protein